MCSQMVMLHGASDWVCCRSHVAAQPRLHSTLEGSHQHYSTIYTSEGRSTRIDSKLANRHTKLRTLVCTSEKPVLVMTRTLYRAKQETDVGEQGSPTLCRSLVSRAINLSIWQPLRRLHTNSSLDSPTLESLLQVSFDTRSDEDPFSVSE
jgi:hypothetical protein